MRCWRHASRLAFSVLLLVASHRKNTWLTETWLYFNLRMLSFWGLHRSRERFAMSKTRCVVDSLATIYGARNFPFLLARKRHSRFCRERHLWHLAADAKDSACRFYRFTHFLFPPTFFIRRPFRPSNSKLYLLLTFSDGRQTFCGNFRQNVSFTTQIFIVIYDIFE